MIGDDGEGSYRRLREEFIIGLYADDELAATLVLKGGNALNVVHHIGQRTSFDIDCSLSEAVPNIELLGTRIFDALRARLAPLGLAVFDTKFGPRPHNANELGRSRLGRVRRRVQAGQHRKPRSSWRESRQGPAVSANDQSQPAIVAGVRDSTE
ncbi:MAG TPA: nucleotidyl transferase AbiEii/AbiGii toxin family protein [Planctomycetota bacterium]|nr:nucleotidyl transferase AbiEii/AbiGii toxin family protein [Planctomycetota bacterium]